MGGGIDGTSHATDSDGDLNVFNVERNDDGSQWLNSNYDNPDNVWNADNRWVFLRRNSFISLLLGRRVLFILNLLKMFCKLSVPSTEHSSYLVNVK